MTLTLLLLVFIAVYAFTAWLAVSLCCESADAAEMDF